MGFFAAATTVTAGAEGGGGGGTALFCASRTKSLMKAMSRSMIAGSMPRSSSPTRRAFHEGSTLVDVKPFSAS